MLYTCISFNYRRSNVIPANGCLCKYNFTLSNSNNAVVFKERTWHVCLCPLPCFKGAYLTYLLVSAALSPESTNFHCSSKARGKVDDQITVFLRSVTAACAGRFFEHFSPKLWYLWINTTRHIPYVDYLITLFAIQLWSTLWIWCSCFRSSWYNIWKRPTRFNCVG
jgi:hypothetical protein